ncbi:MAG: carboxypeptidase-like regulatory domain-containing protein [bacterium]|nr:carboxypeptidase-like regulatory domain-containing protein [bacterium]
MHRSFVRLFPFVILCVLALVDILHAQTGTVRGRVTDKKTKEPIENAWIDLVKEPMRIEEHSTNEKGEFTIVGVPVGMDTLRIGADRYRSTDVVLKVRDKTESFVAVELLYGGFAMFVEVPCPPGKPCTYTEPSTVKPGKFTIYGCASEKGTEGVIPHAIVTAYYEYTDSSDVTYKGCCSTVVADSLGRYVMANLNPGEYHLTAKRTLNADVGDSASLSTMADSLYKIDFHLDKNEP